MGRAAVFKDWRVIIAVNVEVAISAPARLSSKSRQSLSGVGAKSDVIGRAGKLNARQSRQFDWADSSDVGEVSCSNAK